MFQTLRLKTVALLAMLLTASTAIHAQIGDHRNDLAIGFNAGPHHNAGNSHNTCRNCIEDTNSKPSHTQARGRRKRAHRRNAAASQR